MRKKWLIHIASVLILPSTFLQAQSNTESDTQKNANALTITITKLDINDTNLKLSYEIRNETNQEAWILMGPGKSDISAEIFLAEDGHTIVIRERLDLPIDASFNTFYGRYLRVRPGTIHKESISLMLPVHLQYGLTSKQRQAHGLEYATSLNIELGYYTGNLPNIINNIHEKAEKMPDQGPITELSPRASTIKDWFGDLLYFNKENEQVRQRNEEILIPYTHQTFGGEKILSAVVDNLNIKYEEEDLYQRKERLSPPDLKDCTRVEIRFQPSMLEYFFPYESQKNLLNYDEIKYLQSEKDIIIEDPRNIKILSNDVNKGAHTVGGIVREINVAHIIGYYNNENTVAFPVYNDYFIITEGRNWFTYENAFPSFRLFLPKIMQLELRMQCASNLRNLWHRLNLYEKAEKKRLKDISGKGDKVYPRSDKWCDDIVLAFQVTGPKDSIIKIHKCPSAGEGKNHYAMNPNCGPNSPDDMVLLFETKAGWNQHGGPVLFTFDNHDPKGGCVLLNDGSVKFIRTEEELHRLKWK